MRVVLVTEEQVVGFNVPMHISSFVELFESGDALVGHSFEVNYVESVFQD